MTDAIGNKVEMMEIEIKFSKGRSDRVLVHFGDDPTDLATDFVSKHGLKPASIPVISRYIKSTIDSFGESPKTSPAMDRQNHSASSPQATNSDNKANGTVTTASSDINNNSILSNDKDILSRINDPLSIDHKQYQVNVDRDMSMQSFSYKKIATELISSAEELIEPKSSATANANSKPNRFQPLFRDTSTAVVQPTSSSNIGSSDSSKLNFISSSPPPRHHTTSENNDINKNSPTNEISALKSSSNSSGNIASSTASTRSAISKLSISDNGDVLHHKECDENTASTTGRLVQFQGRTSTSDKTSTTTTTTKAAMTRVRPYSEGGKLNARNRELYNLSSTTTTVDDQDNDVLLTNNHRDRRSNTISTAGNTHQLPSSPSFSDDNNRRSIRRNTVGDSVYNNDTIKDADGRESRYHYPNNSNNYSNNNNNYLANNGESNSGGGATDADVEDMNEDDADQLSDMGDSVADEQGEDMKHASKEAMYNRIKGNYYCGPASSQQNYSCSYQNNSRVSSTAENSLKVLRPSTSTMVMGASKKPLHNQQQQQQQQRSQGSGIEKNMVGKSTNERLFMSAQLEKEKRARLERQHVEKIERNLEAGKFKINRKSRQMVESMRPKNTKHSQPGYKEPHAGERLYVDGISDKILKEQRSDEMKDKLLPEEWSCAKCGVYHKISKSSITIQPLHQLKSKARIQQLQQGDQEDEDAAAQKWQHDNQRICTGCGWKQAATEEFKPVNIGLMLSHNADSLLRSRWQGGQGAAPDEGGIHHYLHNNARTRENIQKLNSVLWHESNSELTFAPTLPASSQRILKKYKKQAADEAAATTGGDDDENDNFDERSDCDGSRASSHAPLSSNDDGSSSGSGSNAIRNSTIISGLQVGSYLSIPTTERLYTTKTRLFSELNQSHHNQKQHREDSNSNRTNNNTMSSNHHRYITSSSSSSMLPQQQEEFTNRLVYEYKEKDTRLKQATKQSTYYDETGRRMFQPKIGPDPSQALGFGSNTSMSNISQQQHPDGKKTDIFTTLLLKDEVLKQKKKIAEERAVEEVLQDMAAKQVKPLEASHHILKQSTESNIEELFQMLLDSQNQVIIDDRSSGNVDESDFMRSNIDDNVNDAPWKLHLLDLQLVNTDKLIDEVSSLIKEVRNEVAVQLQNAINNTSVDDTNDNGNSISANSYSENPMRKHHMKEEGSSSSSNNNNSSSSYNSNNNNSNSNENNSILMMKQMVIGFSEFRRLVLKCINRREGPGKGYIYAPRKKPVVTMQLLKKELQQETFHPVIDKMSAHLCFKRSVNKSGYNIEDILQVEGERVRSKWEAARQEQILRESSELTFQPKLFKAPSYVKPKYRGMDSFEIQSASIVLNDEDEEGCTPGDDTADLNNTNSNIMSDYNNSSSSNNTVRILNEQGRNLTNVSISTPTVEQYAARQGNQQLQNIIVNESSKANHHGNEINNAAQYSDQQLEQKEQQRQLQHKLITIEDLANSQYVLSSPTAPPTPQLQQPAPLLTAVSVPTTISAELPLAPPASSSSQQQQQQSSHQLVKRLPSTTSINNNSSSNIKDAMQKHKQQQTSRSAVNTPIGGINTANHNNNSSSSGNLSVVSRNPPSRSSSSNSNRLMNNTKQRNNTPANTSTVNNINNTDKSSNKLPLPMLPHELQKQRQQPSSVSIAADKAHLKQYTN